MMIMMVLISVFLLIVPHFHYQGSAQQSPLLTLTSSQPMLEAYMHAMMTLSIFLLDYQMASLMCSPYKRSGVSTPISEYQVTIN